MTTIDERDYQIIRLIAKFKQLTATHVHELLFPDAQSRNPSYKALDRLYKRNYLHRLEHRLIGGVRGGSSQYVWSLGYDAHRLLSDSPYRPARTINFHTLEIANTYLRLVELERAGRFKIEAYTTEPDCWFTVGDYEVKPDLYIETRLPSGKLVKSFIEQDMGSEGEKQIRGKLAAYVYAVDHADHVDGADWPRTVWVAYDSARASQLRRIINQLSHDDQQLFRVCDRSTIADIFA